MSFKWRFVCLTTILPLILQLGITPTCAAAQFGSSKNPSFGSIFGRKDVSLQRRLPPVVNVSGKSVMVSVTGSSGEQAGAELQSAIENLLTRSQSGVRVVTSGADLVIDLKISEYSTPQVQTVTVSGTTTTYQIIVGALTAVFRITLPRSNTLIASGVASAQIPKDVDPEESMAAQERARAEARKIVTTTDGQNALVTEVARQVAEYLVQTDETVDVMLAVSQALGPANKLAQTNLWSRDLEELETLPPYPDPRLDAYREYNIGVANEALAYQAEDPKAALKYLQEASIQYGKALADRPDEKYFLEPQNRIKTGLAHYSVPVDVPSPVAAQPPADAPLSNDDVIALVGAKMDQPNILDAIHSATAVNFDLSISGQLTLTRAGVNGTILSAMKAKAKEAAASLKAK